MLAVGHSYGGAVITNAATDAKNVVGLVYVAAFAPDEGETLGAVEAGSKDSVLNSALVPRHVSDRGRRVGDGVLHRPGEGPRRVRGRSLRRAGRADRRHAAARRRGGVLRAERAAGLEAPAVVGRRRHRRQGRRHRRRPLDGRARRREDHRGRGLARDHDLAAGGGDRRDPRRGGRGRRRVAASERERVRHDRVRRPLLGAVSQIDAGPLNVGYVDGGPADGPAVVLLHGWPYDIHSYADVVPLLTAAGYRVIVPYLRGFGTTRFLSDETVRNGEQAALALDAIALMDALGIETAVVAGFDWGARTADIVAALWPERCSGLVSVSGYLIGSQAAGAAAACRPRPSSSGGTSTTSPPSAAAPATRSTGASSRS